MISFDKAKVKKFLSLGERGDLVLVDNKGLVTTEEMAKWDATRNIFLVKAGTKVVWQADPAVKSHGVIGYSDVYLGKNGELLAYSSNGIEYIIDDVTGHIINKELIR